MLELSSVKPNSGRRRALVVQAYITISLTRLGLRLFSLKYVIGTLNFVARKVAARRRHIANAGPFDVARATEAASAHSFRRPSCLPRALTAHFLLTSAGYDSSFIIGVLPTVDNQLLAHAWVLCDGAVVIGDLPNLAEYRILPSIATAKK